MKLELGVVTNLLLRKDGLPRSAELRSKKDPELRANQGLNL